jgi:hypothetical protein
LQPLHLDECLDAGLAGDEIIGPMIGLLDVLVDDFIAMCL